MSSVLAQYHCVLGERELRIPGCLYPCPMLPGAYAGQPRGLYGLPGHSNGCPSCLGIGIPPAITGDPLPDWPIEPSNGMELGCPGNTGWSGDLFGYNHGHARRLFLFPVKRLFIMVSVAYVILGECVGVLVLCREFMCLGLLVFLCLWCLVYRLSIT